MMLADKGYDGDDVRSSLLIRGILPVIPPKANRKQPVACDFKVICRMAGKCSYCPWHGRENRGPLKRTAKPKMVDHR